MKVWVWGDRETADNLKAIEKGLWKELGQATKDAARPILAAAKMKAPKRTGLLRRSLGIKPWRKRRRRVLGVVIGARTGFKREIIRTRRGFKAGSRKAFLASKAGGDGRYADPVKYLHLVEAGTKVRYQQSRHGRRFARPAYRGRVRKLAFLEYAFTMHADAATRRILDRAWKALGRDR